MSVKERRIKICRALTSLLIFCMVVAVAPAYAAEGTFQGNASNLITMLQGMVRLARIVMMFVAALLGIICGVMWYTGQQQAQGMLQKFFVAVFFIFGATAILDAILGMTVGAVTYSAGARPIEGLDSNWTGGPSAAATPYTPPPPPPDE